VAASRYARPPAPRPEDRRPATWRLPGSASSRRRGRVGLHQRRRAPSPGKEDGGEAQNRCELVVLLAEARSAPLKAHRRWPRGQTARALRDIPRTAKSATFGHRRVDKASR
jgi:hypothetical protein